MKVVIDIPDEEYENVKKTGGCYYDFGKAIYYGTPLPKGHTRLIEADKLDEQRRIATAEGIISVNSSNKFGMMIIEAETIIEADEVEK